VRNKKVFKSAEGDLIEQLPTRPKPGTKAATLLKQAQRDYLKNAPKQTELQKAVAELAGKTPDAIYMALKRRHITGRPGTITNCPLAKYFHEGHTGVFHVGQKFIIRRSGTNGRVIEKVTTPPNLAAFVRRFDLSEFSSLIAPPPRCMAKPRKAHWKARGPRKETPGRKHVAKFSSKQVVRVTPLQIAETA